MSILIIHLSDLHISEKENTILSRGQAISDSVKNIDYNIEVVFITITGDITYSGSQEQYLLALEFFDSLKSSISSSISSSKDTALPVHFIIVPGNHDCDFSATAVAYREQMVRGITNDTNLSSDKNYVNDCLQVQEEFFNFVDALESTKRTPFSTIYSDRLCYQYNFEIREHPITFVCCNTAWLSRIQENQGTIYFPEESIPTKKNGLSISLFHHPYNWLESDNSRKFRKKIEQLCAIILTGHEHDPAWRSSSRGNLEINLYIEGGLLQDTHSNSSAFNALIIDLQTKKQKRAFLNWNGTHYALANGSSFGNEGGGLAWEDIHITEQKDEFSISQDHIDFLNDVGTLISYQSHSDIPLRDIFVYPDFKVIPADISRRSTTLRGMDLIKTILEKPCVIITGEEQAGKTSLAKILFSDLHKQGFVPLFISGEEQHLPTDDKLFDYFEKIFCDQYGKDKAIDFQQLDKRRRVLIVDDFHKITNKPKLKMPIMQKMLCFASHVVVFEDTMRAPIERLSDLNIAGLQESRCSFLRICPLGFSLRNELIERWVSLSDERQETSAIAHAMEQARRTIDTVVGKNYVPSYPVYVLSILQTIQAAVPVDLQAGTYGCYYEVFIKYALMRDTSLSNYNTISTFLSRLAFEMYTKNVRRLDSVAFQSCHEKYTKDYDVNYPLNTAIETSLKRGILKYNEELGYRFRYRFIFYYFIACYFRDHIHADVVKKINHTIVYATTS